MSNKILVRQAQVERYLRVRRAVMVDRTTTREASRQFGLHREAVGKMLA